MKALISETPGGPETLQLTERPTPEPGKGEVLIEVKAAGVNYPDTLIIRDLYNSNLHDRSRREPRLPELWRQLERV